MRKAGSSFFSNFEVYIAERRIKKGSTELIKLVYEFLPYQKRLSEYMQTNARVYTLRVLRDPSCDESLMQMTWSEADQSTGDSGNHDLFAESDKNSKLPCYRTTAADYQRAVERAR
jgi:Na+-translocating ferredoxin:NAD+ oxidoreductase RnfG subunit